MFAIVSIAGSQERVTEGMTLQVPHLSAKVGEKVKYAEVLLVAEGADSVKLGAPHVSGASVEIEVVSHDRDEKIRVFKMRRRKRMRKVHGHRQHGTTVKVLKIHA
jgi:large subunit ribosomal protein L21